MTSSLDITRTRYSRTTPGSTLASAARRASLSSSSSSTSSWAAATSKSGQFRSGIVVDDHLLGSTGTPASPATGSSSRSLFFLPRTKLLSTSNMFTYWPFISLIVAGVMVTILLVLKFSERLCGARLRSQQPQHGGGEGSQHHVSFDCWPR